MSSQHGPIAVDGHCSLHVSLKSRLENWRKTGAPPQVLDYINEGHKLPWTHKPAKFHHGTFKVPEQQKAAWQDLRDKYLENGAIARTACTGYTSRAFLVPQKNGGLRLAMC